MKIKYIIFILSAVLVSGCEYTYMNPNTGASNKEMFNQVWNDINNKYSMLALKQVDWNSIYDKYEPKISNNMSDDDFFYLIADMLKELKDGHVSLHRKRELEAYNNWYLDYPENFNETFVYRNYMEPNNSYNKGLFRHNWIENVGYISYRSFMEYVDEDLTYLLKKYSNAAGIIIDVRGNSGGNSEAAYEFAAHFTDKKTGVLLLQQKSGSGSNDFTSPHTKYVEPSGYFYDKPVTVLTNRSIFSATNDFVAIMQQMPKVSTVGDTTGGGGGTPISHILPNGWEYRFSVTLTKLPDGTNIESGIAPDYPLNTTLEDEMLGKDMIIEKALELIRQ